MKFRTLSRTMPLLLMLAIMTVMFAGCIDDTSQSEPQPQPEPQEPQQESPAEVTIEDSFLILECMPTEVGDKDEYQTKDMELINEYISIIEGFSKSTAKQHSSLYEYAMPYKFSGSDNITQVLCETELKASGLDEDSYLYIEVRGAEPYSLLLENDDELAVRMLNLIEQVLETGEKL